MAENNTNLFLEILHSFDAPLIIAFCVSVAVGLVLGALVYVTLTWMSRHRTGSASITHRHPRQSRTSSRNRPGFNAAATTLWPVLLSASIARHPPQITSTRRGSNPASGPPPSTLSSSAVKSLGRQKRGACLVHQLPCRLDRLKQLPPHPDFSHFGGTMAREVSMLRRISLQCMRALLELIRKHAL
uniref:Myc target 1b n=1 Tax=Mola mola TaxID=94237 RepID=A0A3Q3XAU0_MOLML